MDKGFEVQPEIASSNLIRDCKLLMLLQKKFHRVVIIVFARWYKSSFPLVCWVSFKTLIYMISNVSKSIPQISHFYNYGNAVASVTLLSCSSDNNVVAWLSQVAQIRIRKKKEKKKKPHRRVCVRDKQAYSAANDNGLESWVYLYTEGLFSHTRSSCKNWGM